ncbi:solute carrier family 35 member B1-like [Hylaeus volcanicus]|uniref:solute carrier family 35 member B1-like n=1 Tax=Hylaeus volcanicus TaxID=313075 RepID=UPI0023B77EED|nr:solute carrier family 35 member B1-like [Hylaeus volcanicus]
MEKIKEKKIKKSITISTNIFNLLPSLRDGIIVTGIYVCFLCFGYIQETLFRSKDTSGVTNQFNYPVFLVSSLCLGNILISGIILYAEDSLHIHADVSSSDVDDVGQYHQLASLQTTDNSKLLTKNSIKHCNILLQGWINFQQFLSTYLFSIKSNVLYEIFLSSLTYVFSMLCTNYALSHVTYPTQILIKSAKTIPVILGGFIFFKKKYPLFDYIVVVIITTCLIVYNRLNSKPIVNKTTSNNFLGILFLCISLFCDSMTGPRQDQLLCHVKISSTHLMFLTNIFAYFTSLCCILLFEGTQPLAYCLQHPRILYHITFYCISASLGQLFVFAALTAFGSLRLTLITTTRKFFTVLLSVLLFGHSITFSQWLCVVLIFVSLAYQSYQTKRLKKQS